MIFEKFLVEYCDEKLNTNPRWSYYAYKLQGNNPKVLSRYLLQAVKDIPWKCILAALTINATANFVFQGLQNGFIVCAITSGYFLLTHLITLAALGFCNRCTNVKTLFRNITIVLVMINLDINIGAIA